MSTPSIRALFRCPDRLIPDRMSPSRRHRGSIHVVCPPPVRFSSRIVLPALYRHSRDGGNLALCLPSFLLSTVIPATAGIWCPACSPSRSLSSFLLSTVIPATAGIWRPASDVYPSRRMQHGISMERNPLQSAVGLLWPNVPCPLYLYERRGGFGFAAGESPVPGLIEICGFSMPIVRVCCTI